MKYIDINGKFIRKDPKYYLQDILELDNYDGSYEMIEEYLENIREETEIHFVNTRCTPQLLLEIFENNSNDFITFYDDD